MILYRYTHCVSYKDTISNCVIALLQAVAIWSPGVPYPPLTRVLPHCGGEAFGKAGAGADLPPQRRPYIGGSKNPSSRKPVGYVDAEDRTQPPMPQGNDTYKSFPSVRMTGFRFVVILTEGACLAKRQDLYISSRDNLLHIPQFSVMKHKQQSPRMDLCGFCRSPITNLTSHLSSARSSRAFKSSYLSFFSALAKCISRDCSGQWS